MALQTNLVRRNGTFYCRVYVPKELQAAVGRKEIWRSLKTHSYSLPSNFSKKYPDIPLKQVLSISRNEKQTTAYLLYLLSLLEKKAN